MATQATPEQIEAMMRTSEFAAFAAAWLDAVRAILAREQSQVKGVEATATDRTRPGRKPAKGSRAGRLE
jgi:hypothetical protein